MGNDETMMLFVSLSSQLKYTRIYIILENVKSNL